MYLLCRYAHVESNKIRFFILRFLMSFAMIFQIFSQNKQRKDKTFIAKTLY